MLPSPPDEIVPFPELVRVHQAAAVGEWAALRSAYAALDTAELRVAGLWAVAEVDGAATMLTPVAETAGDAPEQLLARTMLATNHVRTGWKIRTALRAKYVSQEQFQQLHEYLCRAERLLIDVVARQPDDVGAWSVRLTTARGLELGQSEARRRYDHAARCAPHLLAPQAGLLQQLCPKWSGSLEAMHAFARECAAAAPPGSVNPVLIVQAHLEHFASLSGPEQSSYLAAPAVQQEVAAAAGQSVLHPDFRPTFNWVHAHAWFALYQSAVGNRPAAAVHFRAIGDHDVTEVWERFFGKARDRFQRDRAAALAEG